MSPEDVFHQLDTVLRQRYPDIAFNPSGISSRTLQIPFKDGSGLHYVLTLFAEVTMAPTTGVATGLTVSLPPNYVWQSEPEQITPDSENIKQLMVMIVQMGNEYLSRERQTLKVLNNRDLGEQLARLCHGHGNPDVSAESEVFVLHKGNTQIKMRITEDKSSGPFAALSMAVSGVDSKTILSAIKVLLQ
ncbi:MAG: hypothetical protein ACPGF7_01845 [Pontibacterium sp.]